MSKLNADAQPFIPGSTQAAQEHARAARQLAQASHEERSLFMTFSSGSPLTWQEIFEHFTREYGQCVEYVYVHTRQNRDPDFGRIIFKSSELPAMIMGNEEVIRISVRDKHVWLKRYVPQSRRRNNIS